MSVVANEVMESRTLLLASNQSDDVIHFYSHAICSASYHRRDAYMIEVAKILLIFFLAAAIVRSSPLQTRKRDAEKVLVGYYAESLCPDSIAFSTGPMKNAVEEVSSYVYVV